ncbi:MAG: NnrS family protein [Actinomycetota bacterium]|nr:NnrS family protein [Actinomycetota bacterium]
MLTLAAITSAILFLALVLGLIPGSIITAAISTHSKRRGPIALGFSIAIGFALSSIAAAWAFGLLGADNYLFILIALALVPVALLLLPSVRKSLTLWREFGRWDSLLLLLPLMTAFYSQPYWSGATGLRITAGNGPDIPQNLMTVLAQPGVGSTWAQGRDNFLSFLGDSSLGEAVYHLYQLPSMQQQAGVDYLIYGTRWGLSIPFAQLLRIDPTYIIAGQGIAISVGLAALALIIFAFSRIVFTHPALPFLLLIASISSAPIMIQVFNGGMAQAWALPGIGVLSSVLLLSLYLKANKELTSKAQKALIALAAFGWLANAVTYIDSSMTLAAVFIIATIFLAAFGKKDLSLSVATTIFIGGIVAAITVAPYSYAAISTMSIRLKLASGTGILFNHWPLPSEMLGVINIWTGRAGTARDPIIMLIGLLFSAWIIWLVIRGLLSKTAWDKSVSILGLAIILVCGAVALWAKNTSLSSNYSYIKVATYLTPLFLLIIGERVSQNLQVAKLQNPKGKRAKNQRKDSPNWLRMVGPVLSVAILVASTIHINSHIAKNYEYSFPPAVAEILNDEAAQAELTNYNYLTSYRSLSNVLGFLGNTYWIGKAPNDMLLATRMDRELRVICFSIDTLCTPKTPQIASPALARYGINVYQSPITTPEYAALKPLDRFNVAMDAVGQPRFVIPDRFIGGNPLLKPNT